MRTKASFPAEVNLQLASVFPKPSKTRLIAIAAFSLIGAAVGSYLIWSGGITSIEHCLPGGLLLTGGLIGMIKLLFVLRGPTLKVTQAKASQDPSAQIQPLQASKSVEQKFHADQCFDSLQNEENAEKILLQIEPLDFALLLKHVLSMQMNTLDEGSKKVIEVILLFYLDAKFECELDCKLFCNALSLLDPIFKEQFIPKLKPIFANLGFASDLMPFPRVGALYFQSLPIESARQLAQDLVKLSTETFGSFLAALSQDCYRKIFIEIFLSEKKYLMDLFLAANIDLIIEQISNHSFDEAFINLFNKFELSVKKTFLEKISEKKKLEFFKISLSLLSSEEFIEISTFHFSIVAQATTIQSIKSNAYFYFQLLKKLKSEDLTGFFSMFPQKEFQKVPKQSKIPFKKTNATIDYSNSLLFHLFREKMHYCASEQKINLENFLKDQIWLSPLKIDMTLLKAISSDEAAAKALPYLLFKAVSDDENLLKNLKKEGFYSYFKKALDECNDPQLSIIEPKQSKKRRNRK